MIRALIVDDERRARAYAARLVVACGGVEVVGEARDGASAIEAAERLRPDLLLLDVNMPETSGLEVARRLASPGAPYVIFTTAYGEFALEAFEVSAVDYLLKPIDAERLARAVDRVRSLIAAAEPRTLSEDKVSKLIELLDARVEPGRAGGMAPRAEGPASASAPAEGVLARLPAQGKNGTVLLALDEVYQVASEDRLVFAHTREGRFLLNSSIKDLEERLPSARFFRAHRSCLVNLDHVREVVPWFHGKLLLRLDNGTEAAVSEDRAPRLRATLGL